MSEEQRDDFDVQDDEQGAPENTEMLRKMWTHTARGIVDKIRENKPVSPNEVNDLQKGLENIERRDDFEEARALTRGPQ